MAAMRFTVRQIQWNLDHNNVVCSRAQSGHLASVKIGEFRVLVWLLDVHGGVVLRRSDAASWVEVDDRAGGAVVDVGSALVGLVAGRVVQHRLRRKTGIVFLDVGRLVVGHGRETVGTFASHEDTAREKEDDHRKNNEEKT